MNGRTPVLAYWLLFSPCDKSIVFVSSHGTLFILNSVEVKVEVEVELGNESCIHDSCMRCLVQDQEATPPGGSG